MSAARNIAPTVADPERRWRIALHESGHVVVAFVVWPTWRHHFLVSVDGVADRAENIGGAVRRIRIVRESQAGDPANWRGSGFTRVFLRNEGARLYGGGAAQYYDEPIGSFPLEGLDSTLDDRLQLIALAKWCGRSRPLLHRASWMRGAAIVDARFGEVTALAQALVARGVLNSLEAKRIIEAAPRVRNVRPEREW